MIVQCPACNARYRIRDSNIPPSGGKIRCPSCGHSFIVYPEAQAGVEEDKTSITSQGAINQLVSSMATKQAQAAVEDDDLATEMVSGADLDKLREFQHMQDAAGDDGTVEIKNPMEFWNQLQAERAGETGAPAAIERDVEATINDGMAVQDEDLYDSAPTEIVSAESAALATFAKPSLPTPGPPSSPNTSGVPTPAFPGSKPSLPTPALPTPNAPDPRGTLPTPGMANASGSGQFPQTPPPMAPNTGALPSPSLPMPKQNNPPQVPATAPGSNDYAYGHAATMAPGQGLNAASSSTDDILAAIEEVSQAHDDSFPPAQPQVETDPNHDGPWKLKTNFGLTYEFPDTKSLNGWLASRDDLNGYTVSGDGDNFVEISAYPQLSGGSASSGPSQSMASLGLYGQPAALPASPNPDPAPAFSAPQQPTSGGFGSGQFQPQLPQPQQGPVKVNNEFRPPSREAKWNKVLWGVFLLLLLACVAIAVQTFEIFDIVGTITGTPSNQAKVEPAPNTATKTPVIAADPDAGGVSDDDIKGLLKVAKISIRNKKLPDALDTLAKVETIDPENIEMLELKFKALDGLGKAEEAEATQAKIDEIKANTQPAEEPDAGSPDQGSEGESE